MTIDTPVQQQQKRRYWLLTAPRTASNLMCRILNLEEQNTRPAKQGGVFFFPGVMPRAVLADRSQKDWTEEQKTKVAAGQKLSFELMQQHIEAAERDGQVVFIKEHVMFLNEPMYEEQYLHGENGIAATFTEPPPTLPMHGVENPTRSALNMTSLPDEFLNTMSPTFLIRHPASQYPSLFRTSRETANGPITMRPGSEPLKTEITLRWTRALYDYYANSPSTASLFPIVLEADDIMRYPALVAKYATLSGLDPSKLKFTWDEATPDQVAKLPKVEQRMLSSLNASKGIDTSKLSTGINIDAEAVKWREEFGEEDGRKLEGWVRDAMDDYEYLLARRMTL
ncbi:hypothetical protein F5Y16DRAFT_416880 [Xylariaceae sp. FL0255]|nr:hypothetical protein F5Y16DRAFT_416880 [Xylariaceae sp. FL0255]